MIWVPRSIEHLGPALLILPDDTLFQGLLLVGFRDDRLQNCGDELLDRRFRAHFGIGPRAISSLIAAMTRYQTNNRFNLRSLFMAIYWMKRYDTEEVMASRWGFCEQYCRETVQEYVSRIRDLKPIVINFDDLAPSCRFLAIDTVHVRCQEFRCDPSSKWYSHKFNGPGVAFEVVSDPVDGQIRWINGPVPASTHDITILRGGQKRDKKNWERSALYFHVPNNVKLVGDSAYGGQPDKVTITRDAHKPATKVLFARMKSMMETCFTRLKFFTCVIGPFRHGNSTTDKLNKVKLAFEAAAVLVQFDCKNGRPLFEP